MNTDEAVVGACVSHIEIVKDDQMFHETQPKLTAIITYGWIVHLIQPEEVDNPHLEAIVETPHGQKFIFPVYNLFKVSLLEVLAYAASG